MAVPVVHAFLEPRYAADAIGVLHHHRHPRHSALHETAGENRLLAPGMHGEPFAHGVLFLRDVKRLAHDRAGHHLHRFAIEDIHTAQQPAGVHVASKIIKALQQRVAVAKTIGHRAVQRHIIHLEIRQARVSGNAVGVRVAAEIRAAKGERVHAVHAPVAHHHVIRQPLRVPLTVKHRRRHGADARCIVQCARGRGRLAAGEKTFVTATMIGKAMMDRADDVVLVRDFRMPRKQLANLHAGHVGFDRHELAPILARRLRLHVVHLHVRRTTRKPNENHGGILTGHTRRCILRLRLQQTRQTQPTRRPADLQKRPPRNRPRAKCSSVTHCSILYDTRFCFGIQKTRGFDIFIHVRTLRSCVCCFSFS